MNKTFGSSLISSLRAWPLVVGAFVVTSGLAVAPEVRAAGMVDDTTLAAEVKDALARDSRIDARDIQVVVQDGRVHLSGWVGNPGDVQEAMQDVRQLDGAATVDSNLRTWASK